MTAAMAALQEQAQHQFQRQEDALRREAKEAVEHATKKVGRPPSRRRRGGRDVLQV